VQLPFSGGIGGTSRPTLVLVAEVNTRSATVTAKITTTPVRIANKRLVETPDEIVTLVMIFLPDMQGALQLYLDSLVPTSLSWIDREKTDAITIIRLLGGYHVKVYSKLQNKLVPLGLNLHSIISQEQYEFLMTVAMYQ
jgi:hypothetical protein